MIHASPGRRPPAVTWLALAVFFLSMANWGGVFSALTRATVYADLNLSQPIWLLALLRGLWGGAWLVLAGGLWFLRPWARRAVLIAFPLYHMIWLGQQVLFARGDYERGRLPFVTLLAVVLTVGLIWLLTRRYVCQAFDERHETDHEETKRT